ncbi:cation-transporting P-type ATPase [Pelotomaculum terephthalicicum JT]|uniref:cation-translocating P-type ATPase n=1 Tax=Pelotomaculum terephthalicicum TaxID=206393 RepID=UPI001F0360F5|nr:cation-transporting P-type ATPase [Pelotomaculum terephthalicicum]MCG9967620.1 cation-transporting P-type ATPase [Pelotomaculum terephthalicicum JT]
MFRNNQEKGQGVIVLPGQWYALTEKEILAHFKTDPKKGLSDLEAAERLSRFGPNQLLRTPKVLFHQLFFKQFKSFEFLALLAAAAVSVLFLECTIAAALIVIITAAALLGGIQEHRAQRLLSTLKQKTMPAARVIRGGHERELPAAELVPGDVVLLAEGDLVPADLRLLQADKLEVDESILTGESVPVSKTKEALAGKELALKDTLNMAYMNTVIVKGHGRGIVVHTGMANAIGYVNGMMQAGGRDQTPAQRSLELFSKSLSAFCFFTCMMVLAALILKGEEVREICLAVLSLAVAAVPVGLQTLPAGILAAGAKRIIKRGAIIRKFTVLDTLGCTTMLCLNRTEIFTKNEMTVRKVMVGGHTFEVTGDGYDPKGEFTGIGDKQDMRFTLLVKAAALCNNAVLKRGSINITGLFRGLTGGRSSKKWSITGDATEGALLVMAAKAGFWRERLELDEQRVAELPFGPERKRMSVVYREPSGTMAVYVKGAPEVLLEHCTHIYLNGKIAPLSARDKGEIMAYNTSMAKEALRVLAFAYKQIPAGTVDFTAEVIEQQLIFLGLTGMLAPVKPAAAKTVRTCHRAGIKVMLINGDQRFTAHAQAIKMGIISKEENVLTGSELDRMSDEQLRSYIDQVTVCARVAPKQKLRIVRVLRQLGHVVAVTGRGLADVQAVSEADIGIAMDYSGTGMLKDVSAMHLEEEHFGGVAAAVEEGRGIYNNIRRSICFLLSCNAGEVFTTFLALLAGLPLPLIPAQLLWVNVISNGLPAMAWGLGPNEREIMRQPPRQLRNGILDGKLAWRIISGGAVICLTTMLAFITGYATGDTLLARTMSFNTLVFSQSFFIIACHYESRASLRESVFVNLYLTGSVLISCALQVAMNCAPFAQSYFHVVRLNCLQWAYVLSVSMIPAVFGSLYRHIFGKIEKKIMYLRVRLG